MVDFKPSIDISYRRPFYARTRFLFFALLLISIYSYGWRVTEIELGNWFEMPTWSAPDSRSFASRSFYV